MYFAHWLFFFALPILKKNTNLLGMVSLWCDSWCWFSSVASPICQEGQSERNFPIFAFSSRFFLFFPIFPDFSWIFPDFFPIFSDFFPIFQIPGFSPIFGNFIAVRGDTLPPPLPPQWLRHCVDSYSRHFGTINKYSSSWAWFFSLFFIRKFHIELCHSRPTTYFAAPKKNCHFHIRYTYFQIKHWNMLYNVHTCIARFFHIKL